MIKAITEEGLLAADGTLFPADTVSLAIGETPDLFYLPKGVPTFRDWPAPGADMSVFPGVFVTGDVIRPGRLLDAIGAGSKAADAADVYLRGEAWAPQPRNLIPAERLGTAYFERCHVCDLPDANRDFDPCISCGTCRDCKMCYESCPKHRPSGTKACRRGRSVTSPTTCAASAAASARACALAASGP